VTTIPSTGWGNIREQIAATVRAELSRAKVRPSHLPALIGKSQSYWSRRVNGELPFDTDDLAGLAGLLNVPMQHFVEVGPAGFEPAAYGLVVPNFTAAA